MGKTLKYVKDFEFPSDKGYSASSGQTMVKGYARGGSCGMAKGGMKPMKKADGGAVDDPRQPLMDRTLREYIDAINAERAMEMADRRMSNAERAAMERAATRRAISQGLRSPVAEMARERALLGENAGYKKGGMAKGGKMDRLKGVIGNERSEMARVEAKQRDAGQELSRVRSEMRYDKNEMKGMRKQYPTNRSEPMIAMKKGGHVAKKMANGGPLPISNTSFPEGGRLGLGAPSLRRPSGPIDMGGLGGSPPSSLNTTTQADIMGSGRPSFGRSNPGRISQFLQLIGQRPPPRPVNDSGLRVPLSKMEQPAMAKGGMLFSKKEVNAKNLLGEGKAPPLPHAKGSVNMAKGGMTSKQQAKVGKVMGEFKAGDLHSGKNGPVVKSRKQAIAIGLSEARKAKK